MHLNDTCVLLTFVGHIIASSDFISTPPAPSFCQKNLWYNVISLIHREESAHE